MEKKVNNKYQCAKCKDYKNEQEFYLVNNDGDRYSVCKDCLSTINYYCENQLIKVLADMDKPFIRDIYKKCTNLGEYIRNISLAQYTDMTFKDSILKRENKMEDKKELSFTEEIVRNLKLEVEALNDSLKKCRERGDYSMYKTLINSYKDVTRLIQDYDYRLMYSEYRLDGVNGQRQIAVWEQNGDEQIRNHKVWNVKGYEEIDNVTYDASKIVTRLYVFGGKSSITGMDINILQVNPTGKSYIENYDYYIQQGYPIEFIKSHPEIFLIEKTVYMPNCTDEQELYDYAVEILEKLSQPKTTYTLKTIR